MIDIDNTNDSINYNLDESQIDLSSQDNYIEPSFDIETLDDVPDTVLNDMVSSIGTITNAAENEMAQSDPVMAKDAVVAKTAVNQKHISDQLHNTSQKMNTLAHSSGSSTQPSNEEESDVNFKSRTIEEQHKLIDECFPCLDRPEIAGGFKSAVTEMFKMFYQLFDMFTNLPKLIDLLYPPANGYSTVCAILNALRATCVPDLRRILILIQWYLGRLFLGKIKKFSFVIDINLDLIFIPFYAALQVLISSVLDAILTPIYCVINSLKTQLSKIFLDSTFDNEIQQLQYVANKIEEPANEALRLLTMARHDWNVYMCKIGLGIKNILAVLADINEFLYIYEIIQTLIKLKSLSSKCDSKSGAVKSVYENIYNAEIKDNGDIVVNNPIQIDDNEENIINDLVDTFHQIHDGTKITDANGQVVTYGDIKKEIEKIHSHPDSNVAQINSQYGSTVTKSYKQSINDVDNIKSLIDKFKSKTQMSNNEDNITTNKAVVGNIYDCIEE